MGINIIYLDSSNSMFNGVKVSSSNYDRNIIRIGSDLQNFLGMFSKVICIYHLLSKERHFERVWINILDSDEKKFTTTNILSTSTAL